MQATVQHHARRDSQQFHGNSDVRVSQRFSGPDPSVRLSKKGAVLLNIFSIPSYRPERLRDAG